MNRFFKWALLATLTIFALPNMVDNTQAAGINSTTIKAGIVIGGPEKAARSPYSYNARFTCGAARTKITLAGYSDIKNLDCVGNIYSFTAWIDAHRTEVGFNAITGQILYF